MSQFTRRFSSDAQISTGRFELIACGPGELAAELPRGRTEALDPHQAETLFREGVSLFNGVRYWHAHEAWETLWRAADDDDRDFYQGLIQVAAGLLHLQRRNARGARNKLEEGIDRLERYLPSYHGIMVNDLVGASERMLRELQAGFLPYLIPPVIRYAEEEPDRSR